MIMPSKPLRPLKPCSTVHCPNLTRGRYCEHHKFQSVEQAREKNSFYDRYKRDKKVNEFYRSADWNKARQQALLRDNGLCMHCYRDKRIVMADMVHHVVAVKDDWSKRLEIDNLISLCNSCHNKIHKHTPRGLKI
jgi:5-methylcytosine-specific restriction protein A